VGTGLGVGQFEWDTADLSSSNLFGHFLCENFSVDFFLYLLRDGRGGGGAMEVI
jgi:hypothetical protein